MILPRDNRVTVERSIGLSSVAFNVPSWFSDAVCAQVGGDAWFPELGGDPRPAQRICRTCPVIDECLDYALKNNFRHGVYGGLTGTQRRKLQRAMGAA